MPNNPQKSAIAPAVFSVKAAIALTTQKIVRTIPSAKGIAIAKFLKNDFITVTFGFVNLQLPIAVLL